MRTLTLALSLLFAPALAVAENPDKVSDAMTSKAWFDGIELATLDGEQLSPSSLNGKAVLFVNVASKCGFTGQYAGLQKLHEQYADRGLTVIGVPCNQFGQQEPGKPAEIISFCSMTYGVSFPLLAKQDVNGAGRSGLYQRLIAGGADIRWNFEKFVVGRDGKVVGRFPSSVTPDDPKLLAAIDTALAAK